MEREVNNRAAWYLLDDLIRDLHRFRRFEIGYGENQRLFQQFVNDLFLDSRIVKEVERMQKELAEIEKDGQS